MTTAFDVNSCLQEIIEIKKIADVNKIDDIVAKYCVIAEPELPALQEIQYFRKDLIEDKYIPSPDLLASFQDNMHKTFQYSTKGENNKLKQLYGNQKVQKNSINSVTVHPLSSNPLLKPSIIVEDKEETILNNLRERKLEGTLPHMESSLRNYQMQYLQKKEINMNNTISQPKTKESLAEWKKLRQNLMKSLGPT